MPSKLTDWSRLPAFGQDLANLAEDMGWRRVDYGYGIGAYHISFKDQFGNESKLNFARRGFYPREGRVWCILEHAPPPIFVPEMEDIDELYRYINDCLQAWLDVPAPPRQKDEPLGLTEDDDMPSWGHEDM